MSMLFNESILSKTVFIVFNDLTSPSPPNQETFSDCHATPENVNFFFMIS